MIRAPPFAFLALALPGCFDSHGMPGPGTDGGILVIDAAIPPDAGPTSCGDVTCGAGEVCCSEMCSVCGPAGAVCPDIDCLPSCLADDARGVGPCEAEVGWIWTGTGCTAISGCSCEGTDCASLSLDRAGCYALHAHCATPCGGFAGSCAGDQYCDYPDDSCGAFDSTGTCRPRPDACFEPGGVPVCGCDGVDYWDACPAHLAGVDQRSFGPCAGSDAFRSVRAERTCAPWDGPAWRLTFTRAPEACGAVGGPTLVVEIWTELDGSSPATYRVGTGFGPGIEGSATLCTSPGAPCTQLEGDFTVDAFFLGEVGRLGYALRSADGTLLVETGIELTSWCSTTFPGCG